MKKRILIGRNDKIDLPDMDLYGVSAKIDTGAYTSAIHYHHAEEITKNNKNVLHFNLLDPSHPEYNNKSFYFEEYSKRKIKNSFGVSEERYIIKTIIMLFDQQFKIEFSLSNRGNLKYPILLGRKFLKSGFIVDVSKTNLSQKNKLNMK